MSLEDELGRLRIRVAELEQSEASLKTSEATYRGLFNSSKDGISVTDLDGRFIDANPAYLEAIGYTLGELRGLSYSDITPKEWHDMESRIIRDQVLARGYSDEYEKEYIRRDGSIMPIAIRAWQMEDTSGKTIGLWGLVRDLSDRVQAERVLREQQRLLRGIIEGTDDCIFAKDREGRYVLINSADAADLGKPVAEILGKTDRELYEPELAHKIEITDKHVIAAGERLTYEQEFSNPVRGARSYSVNKYPRFAEDGSIEGVLGIARDITRHKKIVDELTKQRTYLRQVLDSIPNLVFAKDHEGRFTLVNKAMVEAYGTTVDKLIGGRDSDINPRDEEVADYRRADREVWESRTQKVIPEERQTDGDGNIRWYQTVKRPILDEQGNVTEILGVATDITARRQAEQELNAQRAYLRQIIDTIPQLIYAKDRENRFTLVNKAVADRHGLKIEDMIGRLDSDFDSDEDVIARVRREDCEIMDRRSGRALPERRIVDADGIVRWHQIVKQPIINGQGDAEQVLGVATDITELKLAEEALKEQRTYLRQVLDINPNLIFAKDREGRFTLANKALAQAYGSNPEGLIGRTDADFNKNADEVAHYRRDDLEVMDSCSEKLIPEEILTDTTGATRWLQTVKRPIINDAGEAHQILGVATDITDRKKAEEALRASEARYQDLYDNAPDMFCSVSAETGRVAYCNQTLANNTGFKKDEIVGRLVAELYHPECAEQVSRLFERFLSVGEIHDEELRLLCKDGTCIDVSLNVSAVRDEKGRVVSSRSTWRDITDRKAAERALQQTHDELERRVEERTAELMKANIRLHRQAMVFDNMYDGVLITNLKDQVTNWNRGAERIFGFTAGDMIGQSPEKLNPEPDAEDLTIRIKRQLAETGRWAGEIPFIHKNGSEGFCEAVVVQMLDENGRYIGNVSVNRDITDRKRLELQLRQSQKMEAVGTLASGIAHEFENLLSAIFTYTDLAKETLPDDHRAVRSLEKVEQTARQARGVTNALLTLSHADTVEKKPLNLGRAIAESLKLLDRLLPSSVQIIHEPESASQVWVAADVGNIQQVMLNLALNARDAMPAGGRLRVALQRERHGPDEMAIVSVTDNGTGMDETTRSRIFEPFFTTKPRDKGTGLGMSLVMGIMKDLGGTIDVDSTLGVGTQIRLKIPMCDPPTDPQPAQTARERGIILIIQPNQHIRSIMTSALRLEGHEVISFSGVNEAIEQLRQRTHVVDLIIVDLEMGRGAGLKRIRELPGANQPNGLILLVGTLTSDLTKHGIDHGRIIKKPFEMPALSSAVDEMLVDSRKAKRE